MRKEMLPVCRKLALKKLLQNKGQAVCMMVSVILTTVLFTTAFSAVFYFQDSLRKAALERASWTAHGAVAEVTDAQYQAMQQSSMISDISCYGHLGFLREEVQDEVVEIQYSEDTIAQWMNFGLSWGRMPRDKQEAVLSREFLDSKNRARLQGDSIGCFRAGDTGFAAVRSQWNNPGKQLYHKRRL